MDYSNNINNNDNNILEQYSDFDNINNNSSNCNDIYNLNNEIDTQIRNAELKYFQDNYYWIDEDDQQVNINEITNSNIIENNSILENIISNSFYSIDNINGLICSNKNNENSTITINDSNIMTTNNNITINSDITINNNDIINSTTNSSINTLSSNSIETSTTSIIEKDNITTNSSINTESKENCIGESDNKNSNVSNKNLENIIQNYTTDSNYITGKKRNISECTQDDESIFGIKQHITNETFSYLNNQIIE